MKNLLRIFWPQADRKALTDEQLLDMLGGGVSTSSGVTVTADAALRVPAVAAAVRTIAEACASLDCRVVEIGAAGAETVARDHPATALFAAEANDWTSGFELIRTLVVDALTCDQGGLAWVNWLHDAPVEIIRYRPGTIAAEYDADGSGRPSYRINGRATPAAEIIHVRSTFDRCPVSLCREAIGAALVMEQHAARLFGRGARPGGVILTKKNLGDEGVTKMLKGWRQSMEGSDNAGKTAVLWDDAKWEQMTLSSVDAQFQQLRIFQLQEIARAFNIPAILLGELSRATWSNSAEMQRLFLMLCLEPWLLALESAFRRALFRGEDRKRFAVRFERDDFSKVDLAVLATAVNSLISSRVLNPNTARAWLGLAPYEGGEQYANPNTGASQPGAVTPPAPLPAPQPLEMRTAMTLEDILNNVADQDRGREFELLDPVDGAPTGIKLWIVGPDSETAHRARLALSDELAAMADAEGRVTAEQREKARLNCLARHVQRWEIVEAGKPVPFSAANLLRLLCVHWVQEQVDAFAADRAAHRSVA